MSSSSPLSNICHWLLENSSHGQDPVRMLAFSIGFSSREWCLVFTIILAPDPHKDRCFSQLRSLIKYIKPVLQQFCAKSSNRPESIINVILYILFFSLGTRNIMNIMPSAPKDYNPVDNNTYKRNNTSSGNTKST
jgi:hypothetical protein